jgi:type IV pilus biogenesis protein CpaD/CtpE
MDIAWRPGCATRRNIAALAAHSDDLDHPRQEAPRDAMRRDAVFSRYAQRQNAPSAPGANSIASSEMKIQQ